MSQVTFLILVESIIIVGIIGAKLYKAKQDDGKISVDEVIEILGETQFFVTNIIVEASELASTLGTVDLKKNIKDKINNYVKTNKKLSDEQKQFLVINIDKYVDIIYAKITHTDVNNKIKKLE